MVMASRVFATVASVFLALNARAAFEHSATNSTIRLPVDGAVAAKYINAAESLDAADTSAIEYTLQVKRNATAAQRKLSSDLMVKSASLHMCLTSTPTRVMRNSLQAIYKDEIADVNVKCVASDRLAARIAELGGEVVSRSERFGSIHAKIPVSMLETLADDPVVRRITPVTKPMLNKVNTSEGTVSHRVREACAAYGVTGKNARIGVISDSVRYLADVQAGGDLPASVTVLPGLAGFVYDADGNQTDSGEGTAMLEIVHDLAPAAELCFATSGATEEEMAENILALRDAGCGVIVDDISYRDESVFQDGIIASAVNRVTADGVVYVTCAANNGYLYADGSSGVWEGDFSKGGTVTLFGTEYEIHQFPYNGQTQTTNPLNAWSPWLQICLQWDDPLGASGNDYAVALYDASTAAYFAISVESQNGDDDPLDRVLLTPEMCAKYTSPAVRILKKKGAANRYLHLSVFNQAYDKEHGWLRVGTSGRIYGHNGAENAISVGAAERVSGRSFNSSDSADWYSSDGPRRMFYREDGTPYTSSLLSDGGIVLNKPDVTAAASVSCATPGFESFPGTSAAAPHVAAIVALMLEANPRLSLADIRSILSESTHSTSGWNKTTGYGIVDAYWAVEGAKYHGLPRAATPSLTPGRMFIGGLSVAATSSDSGATLRYTTDGSEPTESSDPWPSEGLALSDSATVTVRAFKTGCRPSRAASATYTKGRVPSAPTVSLSGTTLSWSAPDGANCYRVYRATNPYSEPTALSGWLTSRSYSVSKPSSEGTVYFYFVKAAAWADEAAAGPFSTSNVFLARTDYTEVHKYGASSFSVTPVSNSSEVFQNMTFHVTSGSSSAIKGTISGPNGTQDISTSPTIGASGGSLLIARYTFSVSGTSNSSTTPRSYGFYTTYTVPSGWSNSSGKSYAEHVWLAHPHYYYQSGAATFAVAASSQSVDADGGACSVAVTATPATTTWTVSSSASWLVPYRETSAGSGELGYFVAPNATDSQRTGTLTFKQGTTTRTLTVTQEGRVVAPAVLPDLKPQTAAGSDWPSPVVLSTSVDGDWSADRTFKTSDTLYVSWKAGVVDADVSERYYTRIVVDGEQTASWYMAEIKPGYDAGISGYSIGSFAAGTHTLTLEVDYTNAIAESNEDNNACTITFTVVADDDPGPDDPDPEESELRLDWHYLDFDASGGGASFYIFCNGSWEAASTEEWITIEYNEQGYGYNAQGQGDAYIWVSVDANRSSSPRTGSIVVTCGTLLKTLEITQNNLRTEIADGLEWTYSVDNGLSWVVEGPVISDPMQGEVVVPQTLGGYQVAGILFNAFGGNSELTGITIPTGVTLVGGWVFSGCSMLRSASIPDSVTSIGAGSFYACANLTTVTLPAGLEYIEASVFAGCESLTGITIPVGVTGLGVNAFAESGLRDVSIPDSVTSIEEMAFFWCNNLTNVVFMGDAPAYVGNDAFSGVHPSCVVRVRRGSMGWGVDIPGTWNGLPIEYLEEEPPSDDPVDEVETPTISPGDGATFSAETCVVTLSCATAGATIYYTTNGVTPRTSPQYAYGGPFVISDTCTIRAIAAKDGVKSDYASAKITKVAPVPPAAPVISPPDGSVFVGDSCEVAIACETDGATIYYSTNGVTPRKTEAFRYDGPFLIRETCTIRAVAVKDALSSDYASATITKRVLTLAEAAGASGLAFTTGGDAEWTPVDDATAAGGLSAQSGVIGNEAETWLETMVSGAGTFAFRWKVDCEWDDSGYATWDCVVVSTNGVESARMDGTRGWEDASFAFADEGTHTIRWTFAKDDYDEEGAAYADHAWVSSVSWTPDAPATVTVDAGGGKSVVVPTAWLAEHGFAADGDAVATSATLPAANGRPAWECYVLGLDPANADNDFRITGFTMENGVPRITYEPGGATLAPDGDAKIGPLDLQVKLKGKAELGDDWRDVPEGGDASFRFFTAEVEVR